MSWTRRHPSHNFKTIVNTDLLHASWTDYDGNFNRLEIRDEGEDFLERYSLYKNGIRIWYGQSLEDAHDQWNATYLICVDPFCKVNIHHV